MSHQAYLAFADQYLPALPQINQKPAKSAKPATEWLEPYGY
jgi:hypothetical protein